MKKAVQNKTSRKIIPYRPVKGFCPHAKDRQYYLDKLTDWALAAVTSIGAVTALLFFIML